MQQDISRHKYCTTPASQTAQFICPLQQQCEKQTLKLVEQLSSNSWNLCENTQITWHENTKEINPISSNPYSQTEIKTTVKLINFLQ